MLINNCANNYKIIINTMVNINKIYFIDIYRFLFHKILEITVKYWQNIQ